MSIQFLPCSNLSLVWTSWTFLFQTEPLTACRILQTTFLVDLMTELRSWSTMIFVFWHTSASSPFRSLNLVKFDVGSRCIEELNVTGSEYLDAVLFQRLGLPDSLKYVRETVEEDANGFELANGASPWSYTNADPEFSDVFNAAMRSGSKLQCVVLASCYGGPVLGMHSELGRCRRRCGGALGEIVRVHRHIVGLLYCTRSSVQIGPIFSMLEALKLTCF